MPLFHMSYITPPPACHHPPHVYMPYNTPPPACHHPPHFHMPYNTPPPHVITRPTSTCRTTPPPACHHPPHFHMPYNTPPPRMSSPVPLPHAVHQLPLRMSSPASFPHVVHHPHHFCPAPLPEACTHMGTCDPSVKVICLCTSPGGHIQVRVLFTSQIRCAPGSPGIPGPLQSVYKRKK